MSLYGYGWGNSATGADPYGLEMNSAALLGGQTNRGNAPCPESNGSSEPEPLQSPIYIPPAAPEVSEPTGTPYRYDPLRDYYEKLHESSQWAEDTLDRSGRFLKGVGIEVALLAIPVGVALQVGHWVMRGGKVFRAVARGGKVVYEQVQRHHVISKKIHDALAKHRILKGKYKYQDANKVAVPRSAASHRGYQDWHRQLDNEIATWIDENPGASVDDFETYLRWRYNQPDLADVFPGGFGPDPL